MYFKFKWITDFFNVFVWNFGTSHSNLCDRSQEIVFLIEILFNCVSWGKIFFGCSVVWVAYVYTNSTIQDDCMAGQYVQAEDSCWCSLWRLHTCFCIFLIEDRPTARFCFFSCRIKAHYLVLSLQSFPKFSSLGLSFNFRVFVNSLHSK